MTRKDYVLIAAAINKAHLFASTDGMTVAESAEYCSHKFRETAYREAARALADALGNENPRFDRGRFLTACGVK